MLKTTKLLSLFFAFILLFSLGSCGDSNNGVTDISNSIPSTASGVFLVNTKQLMQKADYPSLKESAFFKDWLKNVEKEMPEMLPFLKDPEASGISLASNIGFYFTLPPDFAKTKNAEVAFMLPVADKAKVDAAVAAALKKNEKAKPESKNGYVITQLNKKMHLIQSDKLLAITTFGDDERIQKLINPSGDNIRSNASFKKHLKESNKDITYWMSSNPAVQMAFSNPFQAIFLKGWLAGIQIPEEGLKENHLSFYYEFKDGAMDADIVLDANSILKQELGELFTDKLTVDYSKYIPMDNLASSMTFGVNSAGVLNFLTKRGMDKMSDKFLAERTRLGVNLGDINGGITGDLALGIYPPASEEGDPIFIAAIGIKDKKFVDQLMSKIGSNITKKDDVYILSGGRNMMDPSATPLQFFGVVKDDVLLVSNSMEQMDKAIAGNSNKIVNEMQAGWMGMYLNYELLNKNYDAISNLLPIDPQALAFSKIMSKYQNITTAKILAKGDHIHVQTMLKDKNINSLKSLIQAGDMMYKDRAKIKAELEEGEDEFDGFSEEFDEENT